MRRVEGGRERKVEEEGKERGGRKGRGRIIL